MSEKEREQPIRRSALLASLDKEINKRRGERERERELEALIAHRR